MTNILYECSTWIGFKFISSYSRRLVSKTFRSSLQSNAQKSVEIVSVYLIVVRHWSFFFYFRIKIPLFKRDFAPLRGLRPRRGRDSWPVPPCFVTEFAIVAHTRRKTRGARRPDSWPCVGRDFQLRSHTSALARTSRARTHGAVQSSIAGWLLLIARVRQFSDRVGRREKTRHNILLISLLYVYVYVKVYVYIYIYTYTRA